MDQQRKTTIINEIKYWQENRLLPEKYCDYLLALYTEGEADMIGIEDEASVINKVNSFNLLFMFLSLTLAPGVALFSLYIKTTLIQFTFLIILSVIICIGLFLLGIKLYKIDFDYILMVLLLNIFILSLVIIHQLIDQTVVRLIIIFGQLLLWISFGIKRTNKLLVVMSLLILTVCIVVSII